MRRAIHTLLLLVIGASLLAGCAADRDPTADLTADPVVYTMPQPASGPTTQPAPVDRTVLVLPYDDGGPHDGLEVGGIWTDSYYYDRTWTAADRYDYPPYRYYYPYSYSRMPYLYYDYPYYYRYPAYRYPYRHDTKFYYGRPRLYGYPYWYESRPHHTHRYYRPVPTSVDRYRLRRDLGIDNERSDRGRMRRSDLRSSESFDRRSWDSARSGDRGDRYQRSERGTMRRGDSGMRSGELTNRSSAGMSSRGVGRAPQGGIGRIGRE